MPVAAWFNAQPKRNWWLAAVAITVVERIATYSYFIPTMVRLSGAADVADVQSGLAEWLLLNNIRHLLTLAAWLAALKALSLRPQNDSALTAHRQR